MAKSYYQRKNGGFTLFPSSYRSQIWWIRQYPMFKEQIEELRGKSPQKISLRDIHNIVDMEDHVKVLEDALIKYVTEEYREAVKEHCFYGVEYIDLEDKYYISVAAMKRAVQKYVWGVAQEYGEDYKN